MHCHSIVVILLLHVQVMQLYMNYEETVNYLEHLEAHFSMDNAFSACMNEGMTTSTRQSLNNIQLPNFNNLHSYFILN